VATVSISASTAQPSYGRSFEQIIGSSPALEAVLAKVVRVAATESTVLVEGETGTGKELIARAIHNLSPRCGHALVKMNCAAIPLDLLESELFGHEKGAFTGATAQKPGRFEMAHRGTLFLDEVGDIPPSLQPKLLRVLQEQEFERLGSGVTHHVDVRLVAATNRNLAEMVLRGEFRSDLYYRLNVFPIELPPLRERQDDIPVLVEHFVEMFSRRMGKQIDYVPSDVMNGLRAYSWPGNVRELQNLIERAVIMADEGVLPDPLPGPMSSRVCSSSEPKRQPTERSTGSPHLVQEEITRIVKETINVLNDNKVLADQYARAQREQIVRALTESRGRVGGADGAAARMGISRTTLLWRMRKFGIDAKQITHDQ
jgi:formate hydrogenlyase transcriptional activator